MSLRVPQWSRSTPGPESQPLSGRPLLPAPGSLSVCVSLCVCLYPFPLFSLPLSLCPSLFLSLTLSVCPHISVSLSLLILFCVSATLVPSSLSPHVHPFFWPPQYLRAVYLHLGLLFSVRLCLSFSPHLSAPNNKPSLSLPLSPTRTC